VIALDTFILYHTATRGDILGLIGGVFLTGLLIVLFEREKTVLKKVSIGMLAGVIVIVGAFFVLKDSTFVTESPTLQRFATISFQEGTTKARFVIWGMALEGFKEHPVLGWGQDNFNILFNKYYDSRLYDQEPFFDRAHNVFLDWLTAGGILGLLAYLSIFAAALYYIWFRSGGALTRTEQAVLTGLLGAYFFQNLFVFDNIMSYILFLSVLGYVHTVATASAPRPAAREINVTPNILIAIVIVATAVTVYAVNAKPISQNKTLIQGMTPHQEGLASNLEYFKEAIAYGTFGTPEAREQLIQMASRVATLEGAPENAKQEFFALAREEMLKQIAEVPNDARYEIIIGSFLNRFRQNDEAIAHLERAIELSPGKQTTYFELGSVYLNIGNYEKALEVMKEAYDLEPSNPQARDIYAIAAIYAGDRALAEELLIPAYGTIEVEDNRFINAFAAVKDYDTVIAIWESRIAKREEAGTITSQDYVSLAAAYLESGQRQKTIETLEQAIAINPQFKDQGEYYINEIRAGRNP